MLIKKFVLFMLVCVSVLIFVYVVVIDKDI